MATRRIIYRGACKLVSAPLSLDGLSLVFYAKNNDMAVQDYCRFLLRLHRDELKRTEERQGVIAGAMAFRVNRFYPATVNSLGYIDSSARSLSQYWALDWSRDRGVEAHGDFVPSPALRKLLAKIKSIACS